jgi:hypothetical protein
MLVLATFGVYNVDVATTVIHRRPHQLVYDTFASVSEANGFQDDLLAAGVRHVLAVTHHSHLDQCWPPLALSRQQQKFGPKNRVGDLANSA